MPRCCLIALLWLVSCLQSLSGAAVRDEKARTPPIILISIDTLRADRLSCFGFRRQPTPHIDALAQRGTLFSQVSAQVPLTLPSHVSLLTSTYPFANGIEDNGEQLRPNTVTLATLLKYRGYRTAAFVGAFVLDRRFGLEQGFDFYDSPFDLRRQQGIDPGNIKRFGEDVTRAAMQWLDQNSSSPFFLFLHLYDMHTPYNLPLAARGRIRGSGYEAELGYVDEVLGQFNQYLVERGLAEKTLIVFTSDHGEGLGEHGESTHGYFIYQSTLWVPLIFHWPSESGPFPARVDEPVSLLDVAPTILQFVGLPPPAEFQGQSLLALLAHRPSPAPREVYSDSVYASRHFGTSALRSLRFGRYKYIDVPAPELYDLVADAGEKHNLYANRKSLALALHQRLASVRSRFRAEQYSGLGTLSPEAVAALRSLGYVALSRARSQPLARRPDPKTRILEYEKYGQAILLASSGRLVESDDLLKNLLAKDPELIDVRLTLGINQQRLGLHRAALENFRQVLKSDPINVLAHFDMAVSYFELRKLDESTREVKATLAIAPYYTRADELLGTICIQRKDFEGARAHFQQILTVAPHDYAAHYNLGYLAAREGRWRDGEKHLRAALSADPQSAEAHNMLGSLHLKQGDLDSARDELAKAVRLQPDFAAAHYNLGLTYLREKKDDEAARAFRRALKLDPGLVAARDALEQLERPAK